MVIGALWRFSLWWYSVTTDVQADPMSPYEEYISVALKFSNTLGTSTVCAMPGKCSNEFMRLLFPKDLLVAERQMSSKSG